MKATSYEDPITVEKQCYVVALYIVVHTGTGEKLRMNHRICLDLKSSEAAKPLFDGGHAGWRVDWHDVVVQLLPVRSKFNCLSTYTLRRPSSELGN